MEKETRNKAQNICPLLSMGGHETKCLKGRCAWWDKTAKIEANPARLCAVFLGAQAMATSYGEVLPGFVEELSDDAFYRCSDA